MAPEAIHWALADSFGGRLTGELAKAITANENIGAIMAEALSA